MPRRARPISRSGVYHIMFRGNELRDIFIDDEDRCRSLETFCEKSNDEGISVYS